MRKKVLYSSLAITTLFVLISLCSSKCNWINIFKENVQEWEVTLYFLFGWYSDTAYMLHMIVGLPTFIFYILLFLTIWVILYLIMLPLFSIFKIKRAKY